MPRRSLVDERRRPKGTEPLSRDRVLRAAIDLADRDGIESVSMRKLAQGLGVDPMSLYNHVRDKDDLLDGIADAIVAEIEVTPPGDDWQATLRATILGGRDTMLRHRWAARVIETRIPPGPATLRYMEAVFGTILDGGFSVELGITRCTSSAAAFSGFTQDLYDDSGHAADPAAAALMARQLAAVFPNIAALAMAASHEGGLGGCDDDDEFAFGLDLILDGLERRRAASRSA